MKIPNTKYKKRLDVQGNPMLVLRPRYPKLTKALHQWVQDNKKHITSEDQQYIFDGLVRIQPHQFIGVVGEAAGYPPVALSMDGEFILDVCVPWDSAAYAKSDAAGLRLLTMTPGDMLNIGEDMVIIDSPTEKVN